MTEDAKLFLLTAGLFLSVIVITFGVMGIFSKVACDNQWSTFEHRYDIIGGCMVNVDGQWISAGNVRVTLP
jgi:hypothetical protein